MMLVAGIEVEACAGVDATLGVAVNTGVLGSLFSSVAMVQFGLDVVNRFKADVAWESESLIVSLSPTGDISRLIAVRFGFVGKSKSKLSIVCNELIQDEFMAILCIQIKYMQYQNFISNFMNFKL